MNEQPQVLQVPIKSIVIGDNVRKDVDEKKLQELAASILSGGVRQPVLLTPMRAAGQVVPGKYRLAYGQRRVLASELAGKTEVPALVRELTDDEIEVEQLVENDQREDLHPLDRADYYAKLRERDLDTSTIAARVGRARSTVEVTLRLADLVDAGKKGVRDGWLKQGVAEELALLPPAVQGRALKVLEELDHAGDLTKDSARTVLRREFFLDLGEAKFNIKDPNLVAAAGACTPGCSKRTGAQPDLFGAAKGPDLCTDLPCFRLKEGAWLRQQEENGRKVLTGAQVKEVFDPHGGDRVRYGADYAEADEKDYQSGSGKTFRQRLGKEAAEKVVLARAPSGALVELVKRSDLPTPKTEATSTKHEKSASEKRRELEQKAVREAVGRALTDVGQHLAGGKLGKHDSDVAELVFRALLRESHKDTKVALAKLMLLEPAKGYDGADTALLEHYEATEKKRGTPGWDFVALLALAPALLTNPIYPDQGAINDLKKFLKLLGDGDFTKYRTTVERELRNAEKEKAAKRVAKVAAKSNNDRCCAIIGCKRVALCKGYCKAHYQKSRSLERTGRKPTDWKDFAPPNSVRDVILPRLHAKAVRS